jgi:hypothetical protein
LIDSEETQPELELLLRLAFHLLFINFCFQTKQELEAKLALLRKKRFRCTRFPALVNIVKYFHSSVFLCHREEKAHNSIYNLLCR